MPQVALAAASFTTTAATTAMAATAAKAAMVATLKSVAISVVKNLAIAAAMSALQPQVGAAGRTFEWTLDPDGPIPFAAGRVGVAGSAVHRKTFGPDLMYYGFVSIISGAGPIDGYETFRGDDEFVTFDAAGKAVTSQWTGEMWMQRSLGYQPDTALPSPSGLKHNATLPMWSGSHRLSGKAGYMLVLGENSKRSAYPTGEPKPLHVVRGLKGWDPRRDSTYPGGSGPCRLHDPSTWIYITNPILWGLKWALGLWESPVGKGAPQVGYQVGGIGAKLSGIDVPAFVAAANVADANGWTVAAYPTTDDDKSQVLDSFLQAGGAIYAQRAGKISCISRAAPRPSLVTITAVDTAGPLEIDTAASRIDRINTIRPKFWSEAHRWQLTAIDDVTAQAYQDEDGGVRPRPLDYHYVPSAKQAAQLAALQIAHTREGIAGVIPLKPHMQRIRPGDAFTITEPGFVLNGLKCLCLNTEYDPATRIVRVTFVSETDGKYEWALGQSPTPPAPPALTPVDPTHVSPPLPGDWTVVPRPPAPGGGQLPGFDLGGIVSNETATAVIVEYGPTATGPWTQAYQGPPTVTTIPIDGLQPGATYYIAVQYQRNQNYSDRHVYGPYTAPNLEPSHLNSEPVQDILDKLTNTADLAEQNRQAVADLEEVYGDTASAAASAAAAAIERASAEAAAALSANKAEDAAASAVAASTSAGEALGSASSSAASASVASTKADEAAVSASASTAAKTAAETARGQAQTAATNAANSRDDAAGSAASASTSATNAANSRDAAAGSASAAAGSASAANTKAGEAGTHAAAAMASSVTATSARDAARDAAIAGLPDTISPTLWTLASALGAPNARADLPAAYIVNGAYKPPVGLYAPAGPKAFLAWQAGRIYEVTMTVTGGGADAYARFVVERRDAAYATRLSGTGSTAPISVPVGQTVTITRRFGLGVAVTGGTNLTQLDAAWVGFAAHVNTNASAASTVAGANQSVTSFTIRDVTAQVGSETAASASASSAASAVASETATGLSANSASGSATTAATKAGEASSFAAQAAGSASDAAGSAVTASQASGTAVSAKDVAVGARDDAQAAAASAISQSSSASASAASAQISANLAAQVGGGSLNPNPAFTAWAGSPASGPDNWTVADSANGTLSKGPGANGLPHSLRTASSSAANFGVNSATFAGAFGGEWLVLAAEFTLVSGDLRGAGASIHRRQNGSWVSSANVNLATEKDAAGNVAGSGVAGRRYSFTKLIDGRGVGINGYSVLGWARNSTFSPVGAATLDWHRLSVRTATAEEVAAGTVLPAVQAQASLALSTSVDALTQLGQAAFELILASGNIPAYIKALAGPGGSETAFAATKLFLRNVVGDQIVTALELINGEAYFGAPVSVDIDGRRLTIGPGFGTADSQVILWFGPNTVALASMNRTNGYLALGTDGRVYYGNAELGGGGKTSGVRTFSSGPGGSAVQTVINGVLAGSQIGVSIHLTGGTLTTNNSMNGSVQLFETQGGNTRLVFSQAVTATSSGLQEPDGSWGVGQEPSASGNAIGQYGGDVTYRAEFVRTGGSDYEQGAVINATVTITPPI